MRSAVEQRTPTANAPSVDSIKGAKVLRDRLGEPTFEDAKPNVPAEAPAIYHWVEVAPSDAAEAASTQPGGS